MGQTRPGGSLIALAAAIYLVVSLPVFFFELSQIRWLMLHPMRSWISVYVRPWVHWGFTLIFFGIVGSFLARGRARIALVIGSVLLLDLRLAMGTFTY